tara:strand:- start:13743 stop:14624 length:882 start_codon:yes stop_codon:yes gene_type:complete
MNIVPYFLKIIIIFIFLFILSCSNKNNEEIEYVEREVDDIYNSAVDFMNDGKFISAGKEFDEVERQHPYSIWATRAQIMSAYVKYKVQEYDIAIGAAQRYIDLHPGADDVDYAYYLIALCFYERINDVKRDQTYTEWALKSFKNLNNRFPNSKYSRDANLKLDLIYDHLAGKEMDVGRTYLKLNNYISAINRFKKVVDSYSKTSHIPEALARLTELYLYLGIYDQAKIYASVLGHNYPQNKWYTYSYELFNDLKRNTLSVVEENEEFKDDKKENDGYLNFLDEILTIFGSEKT